MDPTILDKYNEVRRQKYLDIIDVVSSSNIRRLFGVDPEHALEQDYFFQMVKRAETDREYSKELQNVSRLQNPSSPLLFSVKHSLTFRFKPAVCTRDSA